MKRILIYSPYGHWYLHTLYEITIAHSFRLRDAEVKFVCCDGLYSDCDVFKENTKPRHEHSCEDCMKRNKKVFANAGMPFEWLSNYLPYGTEEEAKIWLDGLKDSELFDAVYHNYSLGEWVKSSVHSHFRMRELDVLDSKINKAYRSYLYSSVIALKGLNNLLENYRPDTLFLLNGRFFSHRIALELARERSVRVIVHERGRIDNSIVLMENTTVHSMEPLRKTWHEWKDIALNKNQIEEIEKVFIARGKGKNTGWKPFVAQGNDVSDIIERLQLSDKKKVITLFTSSEDECVSSEGWEHIIDQFEWIQRTIDYFARRKDYQLVIRVHPNTSGITGSDVQSVEKINKIISAGLPDNVKIVKWDEKISSYQLIELSQACLTYWSTVSLEASARGKPVMVCARGILYGYPFALNLPDANEYERYLDKLLAERLSIGRMRTAYRFGYHYFIRWSIPFPLVSVIKVHNAKLNYTTTTQLLPGKDKSLDRVCDFILLNKPVYPAPEPGDVNSWHQENKFLGEKRLKIEKSYDELQEKAKHPIHKPTVSVIVPCYNYACYLPEAVESVLNQTYQDFEIIIVNDGSPDDTKEVAEKLIAEHPQHQIRLINQANSGPAVARNKGIAEAKGEYILPLDADDKLAPQAIELCLRAAKDYPGQPVVVYGWMKRFGVEETVWRTRPFSPNQLLRRGKLPYCSMFHRAIWELQDGYKATPPGYEDRDFWIGAAKIGAKFINVPEIIFFYRKTELTSQIDRYRKDHEWLFAGVIINHSDVFENEEVAWAADYLERFPQPPEERQIHGPGDEFPMASAVLVVNYPGLYTPEEVEWAKQFLRKNPFDILKGIKPSPADVSAFREPLKREKKLPAKLSYSPVGLPSRGKSADIVSAVSANRPHPKVSIITSCYNSEKFLPECLDSIRNQTMQDWELFLLDDASTDDTKSIIEKYSRMDERIRPYYFHDNKGPYVRRNFAIERANSDFIVIQDADDIMVPSKLETLYNEITKDERLGIVGSFYHSFLDEFKGLQYAEKQEFPLEHNEIIGKLGKWQAGICHGSAIIRKELFQSIGRYDENPFGADSFWLAKVVEYARCTADVKLKNIPEFLMLRRMHSSSQTQIIPIDNSRSRRRLYKQYCEGKLRKVRQKLKDSPHTDIKTELKNCKCLDFIEKYSHLFAQWENRPLDGHTLLAQAGGSVKLFNSRKYVSCITRLNGTEKMECNIAKRFKNYDLLRALAYFAIDMKQQSLEYLNREIQNHNNSAARQFISDCFEGQLKTDVQNWCCENASLYELRIIDTESEQGDRVSVAPLSRSRPKVSIITSCYNSEKFLPECIDSIRNQTMQDWELFLLDDASTDGTKSIIEKYSRMDERIKAYYFQDNKGPYVRRNFAIERANSDFIVIQDADDIMCPTKLEVLHREILSDKRLGVVGAFYRSFLDEFKGLQYTDEHELPTEHSEIVAKHSSWRHVMSHGSAIIRKELFEAIGLYDENPFSSDAFWFAKLAEYTKHCTDVKLKNIPDYLTLLRIHANSQTQLLPAFDPRSRRMRYHQYCEDKLRKIRQKLNNLPHTDIKTELKNCVCSDYIEKYSHLFAQWESEPPDNNILVNRISWAVELFNHRHYVRCISSLNGTEAMERNIVKRFKNYDLLRAMACFAIDMKQQSLVYLNREIQNHDNPAAKQFISDYFEGPHFAKTAQNGNPETQLKTDVQNWCFENARLYELRVIDTKSDTGQKSRTVSGRHIAVRPGEQRHSSRTSSYRQPGLLPSRIMPDFSRLKDMLVSLQQNGRAGSGKLKILFYFDRIGNFNRTSPAGTVIAVMNFANAILCGRPNIAIHLTGNLVRHPEQFESFQVIPLPLPDKRDEFLADYDIAFFATHVRYFKGLAKPLGQIWVLYQHCWEADDPISLAHMNDFDAVICLSELHRARLCSQGIGAEKLVTIPNLIDTAIYSPRDVSRNNHSIMFAGGLHPHKCIHILLDAFRLVRQKIREAELHIYGDGAMWRGGDDYGNCLKRVKPQGVYFHGYVDNKDMPKIYSKHSILCLPSKLESFGLVTVEAQACGCIPVVHNVGGVAATLADGRTGLLYSPNTPEKLAETIIKAMTVIDTDSSIRQTAIDFVQDNISVATAAEYISKLLHRLTIASHINTVKALFESNNIEKAGAECERLLQKYPDQPDLLLLQALIMLPQGDKERCKSMLLELLEKFGLHQMTLNNLGVLSMNEGNSSEALEYLVKAYNVNPCDNNTTLNCSIAWKMCGKYEEARMVLFNYLTKVGEDAKVLQLLKGVNNLIAGARSAVNVMSKQQKGTGEHKAGDGLTVIPYYEPGEDDPLVSVIMPAYNCAEYIGEAINSVLIQNYPKFELIIVDDGSTDNTREKILRHNDERITYIYQENSGPSSARNRAIKQAKGQYIIPLDADDMMTPDCIILHLQEFKKYPEADLVYCDVLLVDGDGNPIRVMNKPEYHDRRHLIRDLFRQGHPIVPFRLGIRRSVFDRIGFYDEQLCMPEDYDMMRRFVKAGLKEHHLWKTLHLRRMRPESLCGSTNADKVRDHFEVLKRFTDTFSYDELFPDVDWNRIPSEVRQLHAKCLAAMTYLAIGQTYVKTNSPIYAKAAFGKACSELRDSLKMDSGNQRIRRLLQKCEFGRQKYDEEILQAVR